VISGLHRYVRNPMYIGSVCASLGWALWFESVPVLVYALVMGVLYHLFVVFYEEPTLQRLFGAEYEAYRAVVHRWLPRLPR
jgi:protein-S-isoprenylcysteine O-methyltransferase Ste14